MAGEGISAAARVAHHDLLRGLLTGQDPKQFLFLTRTPSGIEARRAFLARLKERSENRDKKITIAAYLARGRRFRAVTHLMGIHSITYVMGF